MSALREQILNGLKQVTRDFTREKKRAHGQREDRISQWQLDRLEKKSETVRLKAAAYEVIEQCYALVSDNGKLPANKRQLYYAVRPLVLEATGGKLWRDSRTFTNSVLPDFLADNPELTRDWDIVADARGHFAEPHVKTRIGIGTLEVRSYVASWDILPDTDTTIQISAGYKTSGPRNRYRYALFIEKEGFDSLLEQAGIADRYDLAIFSSKGQTNVATRQLAERLSASGVTILDVHDFDIAGLSIVHWLGHSNETYTFTHEPKVIDLGLRLADVEAMGLTSEPQIHKQQKDPTDKFDEWEDCDVTDEERDFLKGDYSYSQNGWVGQRVELNAMTSAQFIEWLQGQLDQVVTAKFVPDETTLATAFKRAKIIAQARQLITDLEAKAVVTPPKDLQRKVSAILRRSPTLSWNQAIAVLNVRKDLDAGDRASPGRCPRCSAQKQFGNCARRRIGAFHWGT